MFTSGKGSTEKMQAVRPKRQQAGRGRTLSSHMRAARRYLVAALGCAVFALVYAQFSHGVHSHFMTFMFAIPLVGGTLVALALHLAHAPELPLTARQAWALALASLTVASCLVGIFQIAGTASCYVIAYPAIATAFALAAFASLVHNRSSRVRG